MHRSMRCSLRSKRRLSSRWQMETFMKTGLCKWEQTDHSELRPGRPLFGSLELRHGQRPRTSYWHYIIGTMRRISIIQRVREFEMSMSNGTVRRTLSFVGLLCIGLSAGTAALAHCPQTQVGQPPSAQASAPARPVGTIKSISGDTITLTTDAGNDVTVLVDEVTRLVRIAPGKKDLKEAAPIQLQDVQAGDRILVRGKLTDDGKSVLAASIIAMKKGEIAEKQAREREEWQKHGVGGLVSGVDVANRTITIAPPVIGEKKNIAIHLSKDAVLRRYAPGSIKFDDAKPAPIDQIKPGDQLRARGTGSADGSELAADEVVSGTFRNIAGTISALDASAGGLSIQDLATKKLVTVKITAESQFRKLPPRMAQRIARRLKGIPADGPPPGSSGAALGPGAGGSEGTGRSGGSGPLDLQQAINRMPAAFLTDLQKGDAVMIVATEGRPGGVPVAITVLGGVWPILQAPPSSDSAPL